jgi:hypothetical protein
MKDYLASIDGTDKTTWTKEINDLRKTISNTHIATQMKTIGHRFAIQSSSVNFDFGMSFELLTMLGLEADDNYQERSFKGRQHLLHLLNMLKRCCLQQELDVRSLANLFFTKSNTLDGVNYDEIVDAKTKSTSNSLLDGSYIFVFKTLFMDNDLQLDDDNHPLFKKYILFLNNMGITYPLLIYPIIMLMSNDEYLKIKTGKIRSALFFKTFYKKLGEKAELQSLKVDIDIITMFLWTCAIEMPLTKAIIGKTTPKMNPMSQIWIYSNIVKESIVNNSFKKLLAMGHVPSHVIPKGHEYEVIFRDPLYKQLSVSQLDEIQIVIATKFGNPCPFADGPSTIQLRFERDGLPM